MRSIRRTLSFHKKSWVWFSHCVLRILFVTRVYTFVIWIRNDFLYADLAKSIKTVNYYCRCCYYPGSWSILVRPKREKKRNKEIILISGISKRMLFRWVRKRRANWKQQIVRNGLTYRYKIGNYCTGFSVRDISKSVKAF